MVYNKKFNSLIIIFDIILLCLLNIFLIYLDKYKKINYIIIKNKLLKNKYDISEFFNNTNIFFNITSIKYSFYFDFNISKVEYNIAFFDSNEHLIIPSDLTLYKKLHIFCISTTIKNNKSIISLANIHENKYFNCIEFFYTKEKINFGIKIYKVKKECNNSISIYLFNEKIINYNAFKNKNDIDFNPFIHKKPLEKFHLDKNNQNTPIYTSKKFNQLFYDIPNYSIKKNVAIKESIWYYKNIYNYYFCFCKFSENTNCLYENIPQKCKYFFYLYIIYNNKLIYNKTDYLLADFYSSFIAPGDAYFVFREMIKKNLSAHYMTRRKDIIKNFSYSDKNEKNKLSIIYFDYIDGNFLEKYLDLILRLKSIISGAIIHSITNLFKHIDYITYICLGHGISYLKDFLYKNYYGIRRYDKILLPPSDLIISNAKKYGWTNNNIIKIGLPRWDIFYKYDNELLKLKNTFNNHMIFVMFTWRAFKNKKKKIMSKFYFKNIINLLNDNKLKKLLKLNNIDLNLAYHHNLERYKKYFQINQIIKYINQNNIINCLKNSSLLLTDFSSIIFDFIVRNKPYIIYIPDSEDPKIKNIYSKEYYDIINSMRNGTIPFENKYFSINEVINKIEFYINNNFKLESKMNKFYLKFNFKNKGDNIRKLIEYLKNSINN